MEKNTIHEADYWGMEWKNQPETLALLQEFRTVLIAALAQKIRWRRKCTNTS